MILICLIVSLTILEAKVTACPGPDPSKFKYGTSSTTSPSSNSTTIHPSWFPECCNPYVGNSCPIGETCAPLPREYPFYWGRKQKCLG